LQHQRLLRVDLAARARECTVARLHDALRSRSGFAPATSRPFGSRTLSRSFLRLGSGSRSRAILPALSPHDVTRVGDPGELGPLPLGYFSLEGAQHVGWGFRARVGAARRRPRSSRPMSAAHGFCFQRRSPHVSAHVASSCSHTMRGLADSRRNTRFGEPSDGAEVLSPSTADLVGVPLMLRRSRASPAERCPPASARDRITISGRKTLEPRPTPPSRVNGCLGLALARSTLSLRSLFHSDRRPDPGAPAAALFRGAASREANEASAVSPTHEAQVRASNPRDVPPRSFRNAAPEQRGQLRSRNCPSTGGNAPPRRSLRFALLRALADPPLRDPHDLPRRARPRHPPSSTDDHQGWVVPCVFPADRDPRPEGRRSGVFPCRSRRDRSPLCYPTKALPKERLRSDDAFFTPGSTRP